jgi:hypothetical protein
VDLVDVEAIVDVDVIEEAEKDVSEERSFGVSRHVKR